MSLAKTRRISAYFKKEGKQENVKDETKLPIRFPDELKKKNQENIARGLRRSPRNLPPELREKVEKPIVEKEPDLNQLPPITFKGRINFVKDFNDCASICDELLQEVEKSTSEIIPIGFDLEWPFSFQTGSGKTALAQICMSEDVCHLLHVHKLNKLPASFVILLSHPKVKLVGVNIKNDVWKIGRDFTEFPAKTIVENNCMDSGVYANRVLKRSCRWSLARLTGFLIRKKISKDSKVRMSKWHILPLSDSQKLYAATDAYVSLLLHLHIQNEAKKAEEAKQNDPGSAQLTNK